MPYFLHFSREQLIAIGRGSLIVTAAALRADNPAGSQLWPLIDDELALARGTAVVHLGEEAGVEATA